MPIYSDRDVVPHILIVGKNEGSDSSPQFPTIPAREEHLEHATDETRQTGAGEAICTIFSWSRPSNVLRQI